jgi:arsenate reductase
LKIKEKSAGTGQITIYHNPACGTSRNALRAIIEAGRQPRIVNYLEAGWRRSDLVKLLAAMSLRARDILRVRGTPAEELGLTRAGVSDEAILEAMTDHPILVERPIVAGPNGVALCRPWEKVKALL